MSDDGKLETQLERKIVNGGSLAEGNNRHQISVDLPADRIAVLAWAEPLASGQTSNPYFDVSSLTSVKMKEPFGAGATKDAFSASATWDYSGYGGPHSHSNDPVSYTHLDVYKRQSPPSSHLTTAVSLESSA